MWGMSLVVWWLRLRAFDAGGAGSIPGAGLGGGGGLGSHLPWAWPKKERIGMVFERGWWNHEDEESAVLEGVWQALQITRGASSAIILEKSYFFHSESSLAPGIHFSTDMLKEGAWKALRGRIALPLQKGWLRVPQSPHEGRGTQPALLQASGQGRGEVPALAGSRAVCPPCLPCF